MIYKAYSKAKSVFKKTNHAFMKNILYKLQPTVFSTCFEDAVLEWEPDVIICNDWQSLSLGTRLKKKLGCYLVYDSHELELHRSPPLSRSRKKWMKNYEKKNLPQCDLVLTVCESAAKILAKEYNISLPHTVYNAPILDESLTPSPNPRWGEATNEKTVSLRDHLTDPSSFLIVTIGNVTLNRGIENLVDTMSLLPEDCELCILGNANNNEMLELINLKIGQAQLEERVHLVPPVNPVHLIDYIKDADLSIIPIIPVTLSYELSLPNKFFESAFADLPIIASNNLELTRKLKQYNLGKSFEYSDLISLSEKILHHHQNRDDMPKTNNIDFRNEHAFEKNAAILAEAISVIPNE